MIKCTFNEPVMFPNLCSAYSSLICLAYTCIMLNIWCKEKYSIYQTLYMNISRIQCPFGDTCVLTNNISYKM